MFSAEVSSLVRIEVDILQLNYLNEISRVNKTLCTLDFIKDYIVATYDWTQNCTLTTYISIACEILSYKVLNFTFSLLDFP